jgi:hypothetical protein
MRLSNQYAAVVDIHLLKPLLHCFFFSGEAVQLKTTIRVSFDIY